MPSLEEEVEEAPSQEEEEEVEEAPSLEEEVEVVFLEQVALVVVHQEEEVFPLADWGRREETL